MKTIKIWLYKNSKTFFWKLIRWKQRKFSWRYARYTHTELVFEDWLSFSSSEVDGWVRFKEIKFKKKNWDFIDIEISNMDYNRVWGFCNIQEWNSYNWAWIFFAQILNFRKKWDWDWFCSEICWRALQEACILCSYGSLFINPAKLAFLLEEKWYKIY